ncbi:MAG TPA: 50S ribosomal protein L18 [Methanoregulaceae archaeon]|nr:50S ribosomal protein L18 [Methanoregulaceae archaeon]HPD74890.1 50S ribosomal protein L18 [Methanoregulaceae archaeon]
MATGARYFVPYRRRREGKTDYYKRTKLVVADVPRMVVRKTNRHIIIQLVTAEMDGDRTLIAANSSELAELGYKGSLSSTPAAYLTGLLFAAKAKKAQHAGAVLDIGLNRATPGARVFAALKGAVEGGLDVPHGEEILPSDDRIKGSHIAAYNKSAGDLVKNVEQVADAIKKELK